MTMMSQITVGAGAGFAGDRVQPAVDLASSGRCDAVVLECLAERTLVRGLAERRSDPRAGYDPRLRRRLTPLLAPARDNGCRIVTNLGSANPVAAAEAIAALAREIGIRGLKVAAVTGDDLLATAHHVGWECDVGDGLLGAHVYLGAERIREALAEGADIVVTGRAADASLFVGPLGPLVVDDEVLAGATMVGHLLECSAQLTGGNFDPPALTRTSAEVMPGADIGYPMATFGPDGTATISKLANTGGRLDELTCTLQLLYEVHDPHAYATPDAVVDFSQVRCTQEGPDTVTVSGARFVGVPSQLKVVGFVERPGTIADLEIAYAGHGALERARAAAEILRERLPADPGIEGAQVDLVGIDSVLGPASRPVVSSPPEVRVHASARCRDEAGALTAEDEVFGLTLTGPAGGSCVRSELRRRIDTVTGWVSREDVVTDVVWAGESS